MTLSQLPKTEKYTDKYMTRHTKKFENGWKAVKSTGQIATDWYLYDENGKCVEGYIKTVGQLLHEDIKWVKIYKEK